MAKVPHTPGSGGLSAQSLLTPIIFSEASGRVSTSRAARLLEMEAPASTSDTESVGLVAALAKATSSFSHFFGCRNPKSGDVCVREN